MHDRTLGSVEMMGVYMSMRRPAMPARVAVWRGSAMYLGEGGGGGGRGPGAGGSGGMYVGGLGRGRGLAMYLGAGRGGEGRMRGDHEWKQEGWGSKGWKSPARALE